MHNHDGTTGMAGHKHSADPVVRKQELLREGEFFRSGVAHARAQIRHGARPEVMLHGVIDHATWALRARADALLKPTGTSVSVLMPYGLADTTTRFTQSPATMNAIKARNPSLKNALFLYPRPDRPFLVAGGTQIFQFTNPGVAPDEIDVTQQVFRNVEYTPLYVGAPQFEAFVPTRYDFGGGFVESFAFDTTAPDRMPRRNISR